MSYKYNMSEFNSEPIDIVVPWVNPNDDVWFKEYSYWKTKCTGMKSPERIRDFGNFKYWFRSVEKYMPWVRYVFLVVPYKTSIPSWLNVNHPKIKVVTQEEYLPAKYNPTFNSYVCTLHLHLIPGISENIIYSNDDFIFCKPQKEEDYFINNRPVRTVCYAPGRTVPGNAMFSHNVYNAETIIKKITGKDLRFKIWHTNFTFSKSFIAFMWLKFRKEFEESLKDSKFRQNYNITDLVFDFAQQVTGRCVNKPVNLGCFYFGLRNNSSATQMINAMNKYNVVCFNDNEYVKGNTDTLQQELIKALETQFPNKSSFEV